VNFEPRRNHAVGRVVVRLSHSSIIRPDETKGTTKFMLVDALGPDLAATGLKVGDIVMPTKINGIAMEGGASFRPTAEDEHIIIILRDWKSLDEFRVQTESGSEYVPFSDPRAAKSLGTIGERPLKLVPPENGVERRP
jgi:hypothetical protein